MTKSDSCLSSEHDEVKQFDVRVPSRWRQFQCAFFGMTSGLMWGLSIGYVSVGLDSLQVDGGKGKTSFIITDSQAGTFGSILNLAAIAGSIFAGPTTHRFGRKWSGLLGLVFCVIGWTLISMADSFKMLFAGQAVCGFGEGFQIVIAGLYVAETSHIKYRGWTLSNNFSSGIFALLVQYALAIGLDWKQLAIFNGIFTIVLMPFIVRLPESHVWLISRGRNDEARNSLQWCMGEHYDCDTEFEDSVSHQTDSRESVGKLKDVLNFQYLKPVLILLVFIFARPFCGGIVIMYLTSQILRKTNPALDPKYGVVILGFCQLVFVIIGGRMMDKIGRKRCIAISGIVMAVSQAGLGVYSFCEATPGLEHFVVQYNWMPVALLTITQVGFNFCMATLVFVLVGEIIPVQIKNYVSGFLNAAIECTNSAALESFHYMVMDLGMHGTLWVYSGMCLFVVVFLNLTLTETSGKTLREIERKMTNLKPLPIPAENKFAKY